MHLSYASASLDKTSKIFDSANLECKKTYAADRPVNAAIMSPLREHIILGGGQDAMAVTTTSSKVRRCKLYPGLTAQRGFKGFNLTKRNLLST